MSPDADFDLDAELPPHAPTLISDLGLHTLFVAMAGGDQYLYDVARVAVLASSPTMTTVGHRQSVLADCVDNPEMARAVYAIAESAVTVDRSMSFGLFYRSPESVLNGSVKHLAVLTQHLGQLRRELEEQSGGFRSQGFMRLASAAADELGDEYLDTVRGHLRELRLRDGSLASAQLGRHNEGVSYVLHRQPKRDLRRRLLGDRTSLSFRVPDRDDSGLQMLTQLRDRGLVDVARAAAQSAEHLKSFFALLRAELGFYLGCLNLRAALTELGQPICVPAATEATHPGLVCEELRDPVLALVSKANVVGNDVDAGDRRMIVVTGANQGGKSTFLRSIGVAQLMMASGMFVCAEAFTADLRSPVFTHFRREEDASMESGKFDEELSRMREITEHITPNSLVLFNESFASTNENEGSQIALEIIRALDHVGVRTIFVTHMFEFAQLAARDSNLQPLFLRAERAADGTRSFKLQPAPPLPTSYGLDTYRRVFEFDES